MAKKVKLRGLNIFDRNRTQLISEHSFLDQLLSLMYGK